MMSAGPRARPAFEAAVVIAAAVLLVLVEVQGIDRPSFWYDEAATYSGASRPWASLWAMLGAIDAVHGLYYALMHPVAIAFGPDPFALRLTSTLAVGGAAALVYALARQFGTRWSAAAAALLFAGLGRTSWMATEARSFALTTLLATLLTLLLLLAVRARRPLPLLVAYAVVAVVGIHVFLYVVLVVAAHVVTIAWLPLELRRRRRLLVATGVAAVLSIPLGIVVLTQRGQLGGVFPIDADAVRHVLVGEFFHRELGQGALAWLLLVAALLVAFVRRRLDGSHEPSPWRVLVPWLVLPTAVILLVSVVGPSVLQPRALVLSAPAFCVVFAEAVRRAFGGVVAAVLAVAVAFAGIGAFAANRELTAKNADWPAPVAYLAEYSLPGDGVLYSTPIDYRTWPSLIGLMHEREVGDLVDVTLLVPGRDRAALFAERSTSAAAIPRLERLERVFYVRAQALAPAQIAADVAALTAAGLVRETVWTGPLTDVETWVRTTL
ncbi:hypothetical protein [Microbacterium sp.]|uniref:hypothetical protein n=1 Tax=Microbacterium sp. TaxID=51671 RepID=UPI0039E5F73F